MQRFFGWVLAIIGGIGVLFGAYHVLTGTSRTTVEITHDVSVNALTIGLTGLAVFTVGLIWVRD